MSRIRRHLRSNVVGYIALFFALSTGSAVALSGQNTVFTDDIADDTRPASGGNPAGGLAAADLRPGSVGSSEVANNSITGADLAPSALPRGRSITSSCNPTSTAFVDCGTVELNLTRPSRVLMIASAMWFSDGSEGTTNGTCHLAVNSFATEPAALPGETANVSNGANTHTLMLTNMTSPESLGPGFSTFGLVCNERNGDMAYVPTYVSVVVLGPG